MNPVWLYPDCDLVETVAGDEVGIALANDLGPGAPDALRLAPIRLWVQGYGTPAAFLTVAEAAQISALLHAVADRARVARFILEHQFKEGVSHDPDVPTGPRRKR